MLPVRRPLTVKAVVVLVTILIAVGTASAAIKLVHMHNGRTLKVESVERDGDWITATLAEGNTIGFPASSVDFIEDDPLGREDTGPVANVVTSGREAARRGAFQGGNQNTQRDVGNPLESSGNLGGAVAGRPAGRAAGGNRAVQPPAARPDTGQPVPGSAVTEQQPNQGLNLGGTQDGTSNNPRSNRFNRLGTRKRPGDN